VWWGSHEGIRFHCETWTELRAAGGALLALGPRDVYIGTNILIVLVRNLHVADRWNQDEQELDAPARQETPTPPS